MQACGQGQSLRGTWRALPAAMLLCTGWAVAEPVTISTPFMNLESRAINSLGFSSGQFLRWGAVSVVPNATDGTTGVAIQDGTGTTRAINFNPSPLNPNFFSRLVADSPALRGDWTLRFTNGSDVATAAVSLAPSAQQAPFIHSVTLSGTSANPSFTWAPPAGTTVNGYRINIYDKGLIGGGNSGQVTSRDLPPGQTSYTVSAADFRVPGYGFTLGRNYSIEISLIQTKDGSTNTNNTNLKAIARVYADFTPQAGGGPLVNLPVTLPSGAFQFNMAVVGGQTYYIDPDVAIGYDYAIGVGNPSFASVVLPTDIGDGRYDIYRIDGGGQAVLLAQDWLGGQSFSFGAAGVDHFRVLGIETAAQVDPLSTTAFVTGLTFTGSGVFTGTQTPITAAVPEPATVLLSLAGLSFVGGSVRRRLRR